MDRSLVLLGDLHHAALVRLSEASRLPIQGLYQGARALRLPSDLTKRLHNLDVAYAWCCHVTAQKCSALLAEIERTLSKMPPRQCDDVDVECGRGGR